jgi:hypothetical protein
MMFIAENEHCQRATIILEPRGLIRALQFLFAIFAFATACNGGSSVLLKCADSNATITASWSYPYNLKASKINVQIGDNITTNRISNSNNVKPSAEFFVFTGVTSMLLAFGLSLLYVIMDRQYRSDERYSLIDFIISIIWTIFWLASSSAWAQGVSNIRSQTSGKSIAARSPSTNPASICEENECE